LLFDATVKAGFRLVSMARCLQKRLFLPRTAVQTSAKWASGMDRMAVKGPHDA
jgi:hypothetical protein